jgi:hypothetical protein
MRLTRTWRSVLLTVAMFFGLAGHTAGTALAGGSEFAPG